MQTTRPRKPGKLRNIGPVSSRWLREVGIDSLEDLEQIGAVRVFLQVKARRAEATVQLLYALQGALLDVPWNELPRGMRETLRQEAGLP